MEAADIRAKALRDQIEATENELRILREQLAEIEEKPAVKDGDAPQEKADADRWPLSPEEYLRYGRQMIVPSIGIQGE